MDKIDAITKRLIKEKKELENTEEVLDESEVIEETENVENKEETTNEDVHIDVDTDTEEVFVSRDSDEFADEVDANVIDDEFEEDDYFENVQLEKKKVKKKECKEKEDEEDEEEDKEEKDADEKKIVEKKKKGKVDEEDNKKDDKKDDKEDEEDEEEEVEEKKKDKKYKKEGYQFDEEALSELASAYFEETYSDLEEEYDIPKEVIVSEANLAGNTLNLVSKVVYEDLEKDTTLKINNVNFEEGRHISPIKESKSFLLGSKDEAYLVYQVKENAVTPLSIQYDVNILTEDAEIQKEGVIVLPKKKQ